MKYIIDWNMVSAIATAAAAIGTALSAHYTARQAREASQSTKNAQEVLSEMKMAREQEHAPYVLVYAEPDAVGMVYLVVTNTGQTAARNVRLNFTPELKLHNNRDKMPLPMTDTGIAALAPGIKLRYPLGPDYQVLNSTPYYSIVVEWKQGASNKEVKDEQFIDLLMYNKTKLPAIERQV